MDMMNKLEFWREGEVEESQPFRGCGSLDLEGNLTITGNLTVQQSQWVYLRGPITSSRILVNGPITASSLYIKKEGESVGKVLDMDTMDKSSEIEELKERVSRLEEAFVNHINTLNTRLGGN
jgi:hypothetical protein